MDQRRVRRDRPGTEPHREHAAERRHTDQGRVEADLIVATDGIHFRIRRSLFPRHPGPAYSE
jgi:2-polyprenyl-6-methoxyphenol hydroxylase-like FAD-dependent oxidoreductase